MELDTLSLLAAVVAVVLSAYFLRFGVSATWSPLRRRRVFPFMKLPPELRELVYEHLVDMDPSYPFERPEVPKSRWKTWLSSTYRAPSRKMGIMLANRQIYEEFTEILLKKATFKVSIDQSNQKHYRPAGIPEDWACKVRKCEVLVVTTSNMLGGEDPRSSLMAFPSGQKIVENLKELSRVEKLDLHIKAIGDPLWNPLWVSEMLLVTFCRRLTSRQVWFHASKAFRRAEGVPINSIDFSVDSWSPGENHLTRSRGGEWEWRCSKGHFLSIDHPKEQTVREFCSSLFAECNTCTPPPEASEAQ